MPRSNQKIPPADSQVIALDDSLSSPAVSAQKRAAPETIVLDDAHDMTEQLHAQYQASAIKAFAADKKKQKKASPAKSTPAATSFLSRLRIRSKPTGNATELMDIDVEEKKEPSLPDAIDVDDLAVCNDPSSVYRRLLGPLRFDFIDSFRHHNFLNEPQAPSMQKLMPKLYKELLEYRLNLPSEVSGSIFVRALESRMDIVRALITGPEGTPYANGCFLFDIYLNDYPKKSPKVKFLTTGKGQVRFNPNLYNCGKVCLSLLGTWSGPGWTANKSTLLQVLVSIQGLILVPEPYYNEPGYENHKNLTESTKYSNRIRLYTLKHAVDEYVDALVAKKTLDYPEFASVMIQHYCQRAQAICLMMDEWVANDVTLKPTADKIRPKLLQLVEEYGQAQEETGANDDGDSKPAARKQAPEVYEIDD